VYVIYVQHVLSFTSQGFQLKVHARTFRHALLSFPPIPFSLLVVQNRLRPQTPLELEACGVAVALSST
jgi:hypothetical protein